MYEEEIDKIKARLEEIQKELADPNANKIALQNEAAELTNKINYLIAKEKADVAKEAYYQAKENWDIAKKELQEASIVGQQVIDSYKSSISSYDETRRRNRLILGMIFGAAAYAYIKKK